MHGDDDTGDELAGPAGWPSEQGFPQGAYEWPPAPMLPVVTMFAAM